MATPRTYETRDAALAGPADLDLSQACDTFKHADCRYERDAVEIAAGPRKGRWSSPWRCTCACHRQDISK